MDNEAEWAARGLFSPSKARLAQVQAKDWASVDSWLVKKYSPGRVPSFERNEDTLRSLLALIAHNEAADEQRQATQRVQRVAIHHLTRQHTSQSEDLKRAIVQSIGEEATSKLQRLAEMAVNLDAPSKDGVASILARTAQLQNDVFESRQRELASEQQLDVLRQQHERLSAVVLSLQDERLQPSPTTSTETAEWIKGSKHLRAKIAEYDERLAASQASDQLRLLLDQISDTNKSIERKRQRLALLEAQGSALKYISENKDETADFLKELDSEVAALQEARDRLVR